MKTKQKKQSYRSLQECLRCTNDEARGYLDQLVEIREERDRLHADVTVMRQFCSTVLILTGVINDLRRYGAAQ